MRLFKGKGYITRPNVVDILRIISLRIVSAHSVCSGIIPDSGNTVKNVSIFMVLIF